MTTPLIPSVSGPVARCRRCHREVKRTALIEGYGPECAERLGLVIHVPRYRRLTADQDDALFEINEGDPMIETLHDNEWLSLRVIRKPEAGVGGYVYSHESRCQGRIVAVLPYRDTDVGREFLVKSEMTPCWSLDQVLSAITGGYEGGNIEDDTVREMLEETGYAVTRDDLMPLGTCYASKSADTVYSLFAVDLTGRVPGEAIGDGTRVEAESAAVWLAGEDISAIRDPQVAVMYLRLAELRLGVEPAEIREG